MKTPKKIATLVVAAVTGTATLVCSLASDPSIPVGTLDAFPTQVQAGAKPTLSWDITHPTEEITEIINISPPGKITPLEDLYMDVRVVGASIQSGPTWLPVQAWLKIGGSNWNSFFYNTQPNVNPTHVYFTQLISEGTSVHFGSRYRSGGGWGTFHNTTQSSTKNVIALVDGDYPPAYAPAYSQGNIEAFLDPYIDSDGKIDIGPLDVIYLYELATTNTNSSYFDMQDLVLLVTFRRVES